MHSMMFSSGQTFPPPTTSPAAPVEEVYENAAPTSAEADLYGGVPEVDLGAPPYSAELADSRRKQFLTKKHSIPEKMQLYNCSTQGKIDELKELLKEKSFSPTEEVSKEGHYWTVFHYASHYGHLKVLEFLIECLKDNENSYEILNMQTSEGKTPLFCAILSGDIKPQVKKDIVKLLFDTCEIDIKLRKCTGEDLLDLARKNPPLYEFIVFKCLRED